MMYSGNTASMKRYGWQGAVGLWGILLFCGALQTQAGFSEPHTVFYGKVLGTRAAQEFLITEGTLDWKIQRSDGSELQLQTTLYAFGENQFSYRLDVPHAAFALGLATSANHIPLPPVPISHVHNEVRVDGQRAVLLGPSGSSFTLGQLQRTATFRLDLALDREPVDSDGDGIPDWWEDLYGLDKQDGSDVHADLSGDGLTVLEAYRLGLDPHRDARIPALLTDEVVVYPSGTTALFLHTVDIDSEPEDIVYTIAGLELAGTLTLRHASDQAGQTDRLLQIGDMFTQADVLRGRVVYNHDDTDNNPGRFQVEVRDENPDHPAETGTIRLLAFRPPVSPPPILPALEALRVANDGLAADGWIVFDASVIRQDALISTPSGGLDGEALADYVSAYGEDEPYVLLGGGEDVVLQGGASHDVLVATAPGVTLRGGPGADRFVIDALDSGHITIADFTPTEGDVIDLSAVPAPVGAFAHEYVQIHETSYGVALQLSLAGDGENFTNVTVSIPGMEIVDADLHDLVAAGALDLGNLRLKPVLSVIASIPNASRSGPEPGQFTIERKGFAGQSLTAQLAFSGTAVNGVDYESLATTVTFPAGVTERDITLTPYATDYQGPARIAQLSLLPGQGYEVGANASANISIANLTPTIEVDVLDATAIMRDGTPAVIRLRRRYVTSGETVVRLAVSGTAEAGVDYIALPSLVTFANGQSTTLLDVAPLLVDAGHGGSKTVSVSIVADADYQIRSGSESATVQVDQTGVPFVRVEPGNRAYSAASVSSESVVVDANVAWQAVADASWITLDDGASGTGSGTLSYSLAANPAGASRTGTVTITAGSLSSTLTLTQGAATLVPADGISLETRRPLFSWPAVEGATWYQLWIQRDGVTYAMPWVEASTQWLPGSDLPSGTYVWWVRGWSANTGMGAWSSAASFVMPVQLPGAVTVIEPIGLQSGWDITFRWDQSDGRATWYKLWVSNPQGGVWLDQWVQATADAEARVTRQNHPGGASSWWVRGWNADGFGPWTGPIEFETPDPSPTPPVLLTPEIVDTAAITLAYEASQVDWYRVYVLRNGSVVLDTWTASQMLDAGALSSGQYTWWVGAWNGRTGTTVWSERGAFIIP